MADKFDGNKSNEKSVNPLNCTQMNRFVLAFLTVFHAHKDLSVSETRFINLRCMKLEHRNVYNDYSTLIFKTEKIMIVMQHKTGQRARILHSVSTTHSLLKRFGFDSKENPFISLNYIRVTSTTHLPSSRNLLFGEIMKSVSFVEIETKK